MKRITIETFMALVATALMVAVTTTMFISLAKVDNYSPLNEHIKYVLDKHGDSCKYEVGKCPESLCSHSAIQ